MVPPTPLWPLLRRMATADLPSSFRPYTTTRGSASSPSAPQSEPLNRRTTMNLTIEPWVPALRADGRRDLFSLQALFAQAHELRDLAVKPHERIALMRLLLCITQAALDGPADEEAWEQCQPHIQPRVRGYLDHWCSSFELLGEGPR